MPRIDRDKYESLGEIRSLALEFVQTFHQEKEEFTTAEAEEAYELLKEKLDEFEDNFGEDEDDEEEENDDE